MYEEVTFERECRAVLVPDGLETQIPDGMMGYVTQVLGGNYTIQMANGRLVRIDGRDADAIGKEPVAPPAASVSASGEVVVDEELIRDQLRECYDPEIPVNVVELGLIYGIEVKPLDNAGFHVAVQMTLTAPGCGMGQVLCDDIDYRVKSVPGVTETDIELVFDPPWSPERMSEAARLELGFF